MIPPRPPLLQTPYLVEQEDEVDRSLCPRRLTDFVGQKTSCSSSSASRSRRRARAGRRSTTCCSRGRRGSGRPRGGRRGARSAVRADGRPRALERKGEYRGVRRARAPERVLCSTRSTACRAPAPGCSIRRWRITRLPITVGQGAGARVVTLELPAVHARGSDHATGLLTTPLRDRFASRRGWSPTRSRSSRASSRARRGSRSASRTAGRARSRRAAVARRASGEPAAQAGRTSPRCAWRAS